MRRVLILVCIALGALVLAGFARIGQEGVVSFLVQNTQIDMSLNLFVVLVLLVFLAFYFCLRLVSAMFTLPGRALLWRKQQKEREAFETMQRAVAYLLSGRFVKARKTLKPLFHEPRMRPLAHLMAAEAANAVQFDTKQEEHIRAMELSLKQMQDKDLAQEWSEALLLRQAHWAVKSRQAKTALHALAQLPQGTARRTQALRLKMQAAQMQGNIALALDTARLLARHGAFSELAAQSLLRRLMLDLLTQAKDIEQLMRAWSSFSQKEQTQVEVACGMSNKLRQLATKQQKDRVSTQVREILTPILKRYDQLPEQERQILALAMSESVEQEDGGVAEKTTWATWLKQVEGMVVLLPADALLQYLAGSASYATQLWGKAKQHLQLAVTSATLNTQLRRKAYALLAKMAEQEGDSTAAILAYKQAITL